MKRMILAVCVLACVSVVRAGELGTLIFEDDFARNESQEKKDEVGKGWTTNSASRAKGHKQVDLKDGAMHIYIHPEANHAVSVAHEAVFGDGAVELRFMLENAADSLGLDFADLACKEVHAGHLFRVTVAPKKLSISDMKFGTMNLKIQELRDAKKLTPAQQKEVAAKTKVAPAGIETGKWYKLLVQIKGDTVTASLDGKPVSTFSSEGFAHPTKKLLRLAVPKQAVVDDVKIYALSVQTSAK